MDSICDPECNEVVCLKSTQVGWSDGVLNNVVAYYIDADPQPMMMVRPTEFDAKDYMKKRIDLMIQACDVLRKKIKQTSNTSKQGSLNLKQFDGGFFKVTGAVAGPGLRSDPVSVLLLDEIDGYVDSVGDEGDPIDIAIRRTDQWDGAKIFSGSTPAKPKKLSRVQARYDKSSQGMYFVPCPHCGLMQPLMWRGTYRLVIRPDGLQSWEMIEGTEKSYNVRYDRDDNGDVIASTVRYVCIGCSQGIDERYKQRMLDAGRWAHKFPERKQVRGFYINAIYSPWKLLWHALAQEWIEAQDNPEKLKAFINLRLGECWEEEGEGFGAHILQARCEEYKGDVPAGVGVLVASADVQNNRIEVQILGFGKGEESWLIAHEILYGNPGIQTNDPETGNDVWADLDAFLLQQWQHVSGAMLRPAITLVDSGAHADSVYDFVLPRQFRRVFACKGADFLSRPGLVQEGTTKRGNVRLWTVGTYAAKDRIMARMKIPKPGPGYMHFPSWATDEYLQQLTAEKRVAVRDKRTRTTKYQYIKTHDRNEALDMTVYGHAGLFILQHHIAPGVYRDLSALVDAVQRNESMQPQARGRGVRSPGITL